VANWPRKTAFEDPKQIRCGLIAAARKTRLVLSVFLPSICHHVLGLNYLDGMFKSAADGDTL